MTDLLLVGSGDSIFFVNYVKALKKQRNDIKVSVFSPHPNNHLYAELPYDEVYFCNYMNSRWYKIPFLSFFFLPLIQFFYFRHFIRGRYYDIIHIHRLLPAWVIRPSIFKRHCFRLYATFWGGEIDTDALYRSHERYLRRLNALLLEADKIVGAGNDNRILEKYPFIKEKFAYGIFGSSIIDVLCRGEIRVEEAKTRFNIPSDKISVLLGYSGKALHQHIRVLNAVVSNSRFSSIKGHIHFLASMTRGASVDYINQVQNALESSGCSYTLLRDTYQTDEEVALFRKATDVLFQLSEFDYLSASIKENLCAGVIMISGSWLPYDILKNDGFYFEVVDSIEQGSERLFDIIDRFSDYQKEAQHNIHLCDSHFSWDACIKDWIKAYEE